MIRNVQVNSLIFLKVLLKPSQNTKGRKNFQLHRFLNTFYQLPAVKKYSKNGEAGKFFGPPYYDPALKYRSEEKVLDSVDALSSWVLLCQKTQEVCDSIF